MTIKQILKWHQDARPKPTEEDAKVQIGCHYEEVWEMMLACSGATYSPDASRLQSLSAQYKRRDMHLLIDRDALLDALCDQIVTAIGVAHCLKLDIEGALAEVARSNDSKRQPDGAFLRDDNGKIMKGEHYSKPDLSPYF